MSIIERLSDYLRTRQRASLADIALGLSAAPDAVEGMLKMLERKGRVHRLAAGSACGKTCCKCDSASVQIYEWAGGKG